MTSGGLGLTEGLGQDISQEELDFSDLFLYNGEDFPVGCDKGAFAQVILVLQRFSACLKSALCVFLALFSA